MRLQRMLGHITTLVPTNPSRVLVIGCGAGVTAGAVSIDPLVKNQTIAEIEPLVPEGGLDALRRAQLRRHPQSEGPRRVRRRPALPADDEREVRRDHLGSARPVGEGRGHAVHARVLQRGEEPPEPGRRGDALRAALREQRGGGEERGRHVPRGVPERGGLREHGQRPGIRPGALRTARWRQDQRGHRAGTAERSGERARLRSRCGRSASTRLWICSAPTPAVRPT